MNAMIEMPPDDCKPVVRRKTVARDAARGLLRTARAEKAMGHDKHVKKLVKDARLFWRWYLEGIA